MLKSHQSISLFCMLQIVVFCLWELLSCKVSVDRRKLHVFCRPNCRGTCTLCNSRRADPLLGCRARVLNDTVFYIKQTLHRQIAIFCAMISIKLQRNYNQVVCMHKNNSYIMPTIYIFSQMQFSSLQHHHVPSYDGSWLRHSTSSYPGYSLTAWNYMCLLLESIKL